MYLPVSAQAEILPLRIETKDHDVLVDRLDLLEPFDNSRT
jgi:hypothetical protein